MGAKRREPSEEPHRALDNWRAYLFIIVLMAKRARAEQRGQGARGARGPRALAEALGRYFVSFYGFCLFYTPPAGGAGGSELSARVRPERKRRGVGGQARAGGGWGGRYFSSELVGMS